MRIMRCELCDKPCTLTTLDNEKILYCPVDRKDAQWKQINRKPSA
jgi:hypothetical protein